MADRKTRNGPAGILELVRAAGTKGVSARDIARETGVNRAGVRDLRRRLRELQEQGEIVKLGRGRYARAAPAEPPVSGRLTVHPDGYGFLRPDEGGKDVFLPARALAGARHGDRVRASVRTGEDGRRSGRVVNILEESGRRIVGLLRVTEGERWLVPLDRAVPGPLRVAGRIPEGGADGVVAVADLGPAGEDRTAPAAAAIVEVIGRPGEPGMDERIVLEKFGLPRAYPPEAVRDAERQAEAAQRRLAGEEREDFRDWATVTIDGETARDYDDAVSVRSLGGGRMRLAVHIADVSAFVPEGSVVDREALSRATSVYFPGLVIPMLPPLLSDDLCSLVPGKDRPVQSVILDFDRAGRRTRTRIADAWIHSRARLTYGEVARFLSGDTAAAARFGVESELTLMGELAQRLRRRRFERGSLDFDLPEPEVLLDMDGAAHSIVAGERNDAHRLIEEFMLAANEAVASVLDDASRPSLYRIHEPPDPLKIDALNEAIAGLGYRVRSSTGDEPLHPSDLEAVIERADGKPEERFVQTLVLRSLMQARYSETPDGHFGLAAERYTHFTSPIRRYPDLVVHRILRSWRQGQASPPDAKTGPGRTSRAKRGRQKGKGTTAASSGGETPLSTSRLGEIARHCSRLERQAETAEREILERKILGYLRGRVGETHTGFITGVTSFGLFVQLNDVFAEGLLPVTALPEDTWVHDPLRHRLLGQRTGRVLRLGDRLDVVVVRVEPVFRNVEFALAGEKGGGVQAERPGRARKTDTPPRSAEKPPRRRAGGRAGSRTGRKAPKDAGKKRSGPARRARRGR